MSEKEYEVKINKVIKSRTIDMTYICEGCSKNLKDEEPMRRIINTSHVTHDNDECYNKMITQFQVSDEY